MNYERLHQVINYIGKDLGDRPNMSQVCSLLREDEPTFHTFISVYDTAITTFNRLRESDIPSSWTNTIQLRKALGNISLNTIQATLETSDLDQLLDDIGPVSRRMSVLMQRGEAVNKVEPFLQYHLTTDHMNPEYLRQSLTVGTLSHFYELYLLQTTNFRQPIDPGIIECAIIEVLSADTNNPLWQAFSEPDQLNWVDSWDGFSHEFRAEHGFN
jgi:hypothetical protein